MDLSTTALGRVASARGPLEALRAARPTARGVSSHVQPCLGFPPQPELSPPAKGEAAEGGLAAGGEGQELQRGDRHPQSARQRSMHLQAFSVIQGYWAIFLNSDWLGIRKENCCLTHLCIVKPEQASRVVMPLQIFSCKLDNTLLL